MQTWSDVKAEVLADDAGKKDMLVNPHKLDFIAGDDFTNAVLLPTEVSVSRQLLTLTEWATTQLCNMLAIPSRYFKRCPAELREDQIDYWITAQPDDDVLLRTKGDHLRAVLSQRYTPFDNADVLDAWQAGDLIERFEYDLALTDKALYLRAVNADAVDGNGDAAYSEEVRAFMREQQLAAGVLLRNSEVGAKAISVDSFVHCFICSNGMIFMSGGTNYFQQRHIHIKREALVEQMRHAVNSAQRQAGAGIEHLYRASLTPVDEDEAIKALQTRGFDDDQIATVVQLFGDTYDGKTAYGFVSAVTEHAQRHDNPEARYDEERFAGALLASLVA